MTYEPPLERGGNPEVCIHGKYNRNARVIRRHTTRAAHRGARLVTLVGLVLLFGPPGAYAVSEATTAVPALTGTQGATETPANAAPWHFAAELFTRVFGEQSHSRSIYVDSGTAVATATTTADTRAGFEMRVWYDGSGSESATAMGHPGLVFTVGANMAVASIPTVDTQDTAIVVPNYPDAPITYVVAPSQLTAYEVEASAAFRVLSVGNAALLLDLRYSYRWSLATARNAYGWILVGNSGSAVLPQVVSNSGVTYARNRTDDGGFAGVLLEMPFGRGAFSASLGYVPALIQYAERDATTTSTATATGYVNGVKGTLATTVPLSRGATTPASPSLSPGGPEERKSVTSLVIRAIGEFDFGSATASSTWYGNGDPYHPPGTNVSGITVGLTAFRVGTEVGIQFAY